MMKNNKIIFSSLIIITILISLFYIISDPGQMTMLSNEKLKKIAYIITDLIHKNSSDDVDIKLIVSSDDFAKEIEKSKIPYDVHKIRDSIFYFQKILHLKYEEENLRILEIDAEQLNKSKCKIVLFSNGSAITENKK